jgi:hypothetical protein
MSSLQAEMDGNQIKVRRIYFEKYVKAGMKTQKPKFSKGDSVKNFKERRIFHDEVGNAGAASTNNGYLKRQAMFAESKWVYFCINIHADITTLRKYIPPNLKIMMELQRNSDESCLLTHQTIENFKIELDDLRMTGGRNSES